MVDFWEAGCGEQVQKKVHSQLEGYEWEKVPEMDCSYDQKLHGVMVDCEIGDHHASPRDQNFFVKLAGSSSEYYC